MVSLREGLKLGDGGVISLVGAGGKTSLMYRLAHELARSGESVLTTTTTKIYEPRPDQSAHLILSDSVARILEMAREVLKSDFHITAAARKLPAQGKLRGFAPELVADMWHSGLFRWILVEADGAAGRPLKAPADHEPQIPACSSQLVGVVGLDGAGRPLNDRWVFRPDRFTQISGLAHGSEVTAAAIIAVLEHDKGIFKNAPADATRIVFCNQADVPRNLAAGRRIVRTLINRKKTGLNRVAIGQALFFPPVLEAYDLNTEFEYETQR